MRTIKTGFVSLVGIPNVGKSTLLNALIDENLAIVTRKPQTTRQNIRGIYTDSEYQIVFVDTPGIHTPHTRLGEHMVKSALSSMKDTDCIIMVIDAKRKIGVGERRIIEDIKRKKYNVIAVINKADAVVKEEILPIISELSGFEIFKEIIPISALRKDGVPIVLEHIKRFMPEGEKYYDDSEFTDMTEREIIAEIIRGQMLETLNDEVPHGVAIEIVSMARQAHITKIEAIAFCEKSTHKGIIIGKDGAMLKRISTRSRKAIEDFLDERVYLNLWIKIKDDWRNNDTKLRQLSQL